MAQTLNTNNSIVDYLKAQGQDSSFSARAEYANQHGVKGYTGTANQNASLMGTMKTGVAPKQVQPTAPTQSANGAQSAINRYLSSQQSGSIAKPTDTTAMQESADARIEDMKGNNQDLYGTQLKEQKALIDQNTQSQITALQKAYADAVMNGELSEAEAEKQFNENVSAIQQKAYQDAQATNLTAESRGMGNSQQMLGMQASDNARTNQNVTTARTARDGRINELKTRLNAITTQKDLDLANAQNQGNMQYQQAMYGLQGKLMENNSALDQQAFASEMDLNKMRAGQEFDIGMAGQNQQYTQDNMGLQQEYTQDNMATEQGYTQQNMATQQGYTQQNMSTQQSYTLQSMAKQYGYDVNKMSIQQKNDLTKMATQQQYDVSNIQRQFSNNVSLSNLEYRQDMNMSNTQFNQSKQMASYNAGLQIQQAQKEYTQSRSWELAKYQPGTSEYNIVQGQMKQDMTSIKKEIETRAMAEAVAAVQNPKKKEEKKKTKKWYDAFILG